MPVLQPISRIGTTLWDFLGLSKSSGQSFTGVSGDIVPTINAAPFLAAEIYEEVFATIPAPGLGNNVAYTNNTPNVQIIYAIGAIGNGVVGVGVTYESRPVLIGAVAGNPVVIPVGTADTGFAGERILSGGAFFDAPLPLLPGWSIGLSVTTLTGGAAPSTDVRFLIARP